MTKFTNIEGLTTQDDVFFECNFEGCIGCIRVETEVFIPVKNKAAKLSYKA